MTCRFTIIMPSYLGDYPTAASCRQLKIVRAINSVINQTFKDWELIIVADGCAETVEIASKFKDERIKCILIDKAPFWDGGPRNTGLTQARGEICTYLDNDDYLGVKHLKIINDHFKHYDWIYYNDYFYHSGDQWTQRQCNIDTNGMIGTSNLSHRTSIGATWGGDYGHDYHFVQRLKALSSNYAKTTAAEYCVMHAYNMYDL